MRDYEVNYQQQQQSLTALAEQLPLSAMNDPKQMALLSYCCVALPHSEGSIAADVLPQVGMDWFIQICVVRVLQQRTPGCCSRGLPSGIT